MFPDPVTVSDGDECYGTKLYCLALSCHCILHFNNVHETNTVLVPCVP